MPLGQYNSETAITKKEAIEVLEKERLIRNPRVLEVLWILAKVAVRNLDIPLNAHLFTHGTFIRPSKTYTKLTNRNIAVSGYPCPAQHFTRSSSWG